MSLLIKSCKTEWHPISAASDKKRKSFEKQKKNEVLNKSTGQQNTHLHTISLNKNNYLCYKVIPKQLDRRAKSKIA